MENKNLDPSKKKKKGSENEFNQISTYIKNFIDNNIYVPMFGDFNAKIGKDEEDIVNGDRIIGRNRVLLRDTIKIEKQQLMNCMPFFMGKWIRINTCNNNEKSILDYGLCNTKLASMISKVVIDELQEYKMKERKYSDHNTFVIEKNTPN